MQFLKNIHTNKAITVTLTGDCEKIYQRFLKRNDSSDRYRGHVVNGCYSKKIQNSSAPPVSYESLVGGIANRRMERFAANGPHIILDTTDFTQIDQGKLLQRIRNYLNHGGRYDWRKGKSYS